MRFTSFRNKSQIRLEKQKIVFQFTVVLIASFVAGTLFIRLISDEALRTISERISNHFLSEASKSFFFKNCTVDILCVFILYLFSFSFINYVVSDIIIAFTSFNFGIFSRLCILFNNQFSILIFFKLVLLLLIYIYSCKIAMDSLKLKKFLPNGRISIDNKTFTKITVLTVSVIAVILIINGLYCLF